MNKLDLTQANQMELYSYQIALLTMINHMREELVRVKEKLEQVKEKGSQ
jgi:hypothetical protein